MNKVILRTFRSQNLLSILNVQHRLRYYGTRYYAHYYNNYKKRLIIINKNKYNTSYFIPTT